MQANNRFLRLDNVTPRVPGVEFTTSFTFDINSGEAWAFYGENGSGKSLIAQVIKGSFGVKSGEIIYDFMKEERERADSFVYPSQFIKVVGFEAAYTMSSFRDAYYQQRFSSVETDWYPKVRELLPDTEEGCRTAEMLNLVPLMDSSLITLSSGQLRRLLIAKAMLEHPRMLIFDNPFIGLDVKSRKMLNSMFEILMKDGVQLIFLTPTLRDIPPVTTNVLYLDKLQCRFAGLRREFEALGVKESGTDGVDFDMASGPKVTLPDFDVVVKMEHLNIDYADVIYQRNLNWTIRRGERWALLGPNGSGKSTLLSYIFADNPQAYSKPLTLFDRKRGSGESIWDIKRHIGFTSSEMHLYYLENVPCHSVVESGFFDSVGLYRRPSDEQKAFAKKVMCHLGLDAIADKGFLKVSSGEQRLVLFARAMVKNPDLLILDEPFHGIDYRRKKMCLRMIDDYLRQRDKSIIFVTHYEEEIPKQIDKVFELKK